jgi:hypothetical protein
MYIFGRKIYLIVYVIESTLRINLRFSIWTNINKLWNIEIDVCAMFKIKYGVNKMHSITFSHHVGWFDGKGVDIHSWGLRIKPHKWHNCGQWWYVDRIYPT